MYDQEPSKNPRVFKTHNSWQDEAITDRLKRLYAMKRRCYLKSRVTRKKNKNSSFIACETLKLEDLKLDNVKNALRKRE